MSSRGCSTTCHAVTPEGKRLLPRSVRRHFAVLDMKPIQGHYSHPPHANREHGVEMTALLYDILTLPDR